MHKFSAAFIQDVRHRAQAASENAATLLSQADSAQAEANRLRGLAEMEETRADGYGRMLELIAADTDPADGRTAAAR